MPAGNQGYPNQYVQQPQQGMPSGNQGYPNQYVQQPQQGMPAGNQSYTNRYSQQQYQYQPNGGKRRTPGMQYQYHPSNLTDPIQFQNQDEMEKEKASIRKIINVEWIILMLYSAFVVIYSLFFGGGYGSKKVQEMCYDLINGAMVVDALYIFLVIVACVWLTFARFKIVNFQKNAWKWYVSCLFFCCGVIIFYIVCSCAVVSASDFEINSDLVVRRVRLLATAYIPGAICSYIYFKKRKHLFVN